MSKFQKLKFNKKKYDHIKMPKVRVAFKAKLINNLKLFMKDLKRSRWVSFKNNRKTFLKVTLFIVITSLILFGIAIGFSSLWNVLGVGIND